MYDAESACAPQRLAIAHREAARPVRQEEALVRVQRHRVGALDPPHRRAPPLGEREEAAVRRVDVQPEALGLGEVGEGGQIVHGAGARRARRGDEQEGREAARPVARHRLRRRVGPHAEAPVHRDRAHGFRRKAGEERGLRHRVVRFLRGIERPPQEVRREAIAARGDHRDEVRERAARREDPPGALGQAEHGAEPGDHVDLDLHEQRGGLEDAHIPVHRVGDQIGHRRVKEPAARDIPHVTGRRGVQAHRDDLAEEPPEELLVRHTALGQRLTERAREPLASPRRVHRLLRQALDVPHDAVHRELDHLAHDVARQLERVRA
ncbi:hypothetical protein WME92_01400 [Sorangium sp. So ce307]